MEKEGQERADSKFSFDDFVRFYTDGDFSLVTPEFKAEMDEYEAFYDEYISFMQKYMSGSSNIIDMFEDYGEMIKRLEKWDEEIDTVDESKLTPADDAYFVLCYHSNC